MDVGSLSHCRRRDVSSTRAASALFEPAVKSLRFGGRETGIITRKLLAEFNLGEIYDHDRHVTGLASLFIDPADGAKIRPTRWALRQRPAYCTGHKDVAAREQR